MSKLLLASLLCLSGALLDPQRAFSFVDTQAHFVGGKIKGAFDIKHILPGLK
jgi:hypothetical protein